MEAGHASRNTLQKYYRDLHKLQGFLQGRGLTQDLLEEYRVWLTEGQHYKEASVRSYLSVANHFCEEMGWKIRCPDIKPDIQMKPAPKRNTQLSYTEYVLLIRTALNCGMDHLAMLIQVLGNTDLRIGELPYLCVECLESGIVPVMRKGGEYMVELPTPLLPALRRYAEYRGITKGVLFRTSTGAPMNRSNLWKEMQQLAKIAGIGENKLSARKLKQPFMAEVFSVEKERCQAPYYDK